MYLNGATDWSAKQVKIVPDSTCEAETAVGSFATKSVCFSRELLKAHSRPLQGPTIMLGDNKAMFDMIQQEGASSRTRYYERATLLIKRATLLLILKPLLIKTSDMLADVFTKPTEKPLFQKFRDVMMNVHNGLRAMLACALVAVHGDSHRLATRLLARL